MVIAIFLAGDLGVEYPTTAFADDFSYSRVRLHPGDFSLIPLLQRFLIFVFPITIPHGIFPSFHETRRVKKSDPPHPVLYGFSFLFPGPLLPILHFTVRFPLASLAAVFHIVPGRDEHFPTVSADTFPLSAFRRLLPVEFSPASRTAK